MGCLTRESFATDFLEKKRKVTKVLRNCPVQDLGQFKRQCIEVLEGIP